MRASLDARVAWRVVTAPAVAAALLVTSAHATEAAMTAGDLKELCSGSDHVSRNVCRIYILGVTEGLSQGLRIAAGNGAKVCVPEGVSAEQLEKTIKARLDADLAHSPARGTADAASFLSAALAQAFPCPGSRPVQR
jgi:Rap1a immunity proteins